MKRVTGIGGIFFKAKDAPALQAWYKRHLGIDVQSWGGAAFTWAFTSCDFPLGKTNTLSDRLTATGGTMFTGRMSSPRSGSTYR